MVLRLFQRSCGYGVLPCSKEKDRGIMRKGRCIMRETGHTMTVSGDGVACVCQRVLASGAMSLREAAETLHVQSVSKSRHERFTV